jgi:redox-sensitive bicupin YhaK (pirin superfamily)
MTTNSNVSRDVEEILQAKPASDGDGVRLLRVFGGNNLARFDPFLMLDEFGSFEASDYIGGFPSHPHRGFETVTYMLEGKMEHRDHMGNVGLLEPGDVQWMKAGAGVIHSEMPKQEQGRMRGFQLWVNLPAAEKMTPATYDDIAADRIPVYSLPGMQVKAIAGRLTVNNKVLDGAVNDRSSEPGYLDIQVGNDALELSIQVPDGHTALVYVYEGGVAMGRQQTRVTARQMARLSRNGTVQLSADANSGVLLITGKPIGEPIVHYGPFVMNTREEIEQAIADYNTGRLTG